jgi:imidazolonepropionase-like amidohydrolase
VRAFVLPLLLLLTLPGTFAQGTGVLVLVHANVIDGTSDEVIQDVTIVLDKGRIASVGTTVSIPEGSTVLDVGGRWVLPGYVDAHTHIDTYAKAQRAIATGVTTTRTMQVEYFADVGLRELHRQGLVDIPEILASGYQIRPDMFPGFFLDFPHLAALMPKYSGSENVRTVVRANLSRGVDHIKILATPRSRDNMLGRTFSDEEMSAIVAEAKSAGKRVSAHAHGDDGIAAAARAGVHTIDHATFATDDTLRLIKERGTCIVTTISQYDAKAWRMPPDVQARTQKQRDAARSMVARAYGMRIPIVGGTDFEYDSEENDKTELTVAREAGELVNSGLPVAQAIKSITSRAAECLNIADRVGTIRPGLEADLVILGRNPLGDIGALKDVQIVVNNGKVALNRAAAAK